MKTLVNYQHRNVARVVYNSRSPMPDVWSYRTRVIPWQFAIIEIITMMVWGFLLFM